MSESQQMFGGNHTHPNASGPQGSAEGQQQGAQQAQPSPAARMQALQQRIQVQRQSLANLEENLDYFNGLYMTSQMTLAELVTENTRLADRVRELEGQLAASGQNQPSEGGE